MSRIQNPADESFDCQCLLHTYYSVPSIATTIVKGMQGHTGVESVTTGKRRGTNLDRLVLLMSRICGRA